MQSVELFGQQEDTLFDPLQLEIGLDRLGVERILLALVFLAVIGPVPRHQRPFEALRGGKAGYRAVIGVGIPLRLVEQLPEERTDGRRVLGHALLEHIVRIAFIAQQVGQPEARIGDPLDDLRVVELAAQRARTVRPPQLLLERPVRGVGHEGQVAGVLQRHGPPLLPARTGLGGHPFADEFRQFGDRRRIGDVEREGVGRGQRIAVELQRKGRQFGGVLPVELLVGVRQRRAVAGEALVGLLQQASVLGRKAPSGMLIDGLHAREQFGIERNVVGQLRQAGLDAHGDLLHLLRRVGAQQVEEDARYPVQQLALTLQRHDRVAEGRLLRVLHDRLDLGARAGDGRIERSPPVRSGRTAAWHGASSTPPAADSRCPVRADRPGESNCRRIRPQVSKGS